MKTNFKFPMSKAERIIGWIYIPVHAVIVPLVIAFLYAAFSPSIIPELTDPQLNLVYYAFSFLFVLAAMFRYLKASFSDLFDDVIGSITSILLGFPLYSVMTAAVGFALIYFLGDAINPNTESILNAAKLNVNVMFVVSVLFAPVVEEVLFRGALFGTLRTKNRLLAYIVSALVFSLYHLWQSMLLNFDWTLLLFILQYVPASIALAWCYERSGSIWSSILLHALINFVFLSVNIGLF